MKSPLSLDQVLLDVAQVPAEAVIGSHGSIQRIQVPGSVREAFERWAGQFPDGLIVDSKGAVILSPPDWML